MDVEDVVCVGRVCELRMLWFSLAGVCFCLMGANNYETRSFFVRRSGVSLFVRHTHRSTNLPDLSIKKHSIISKSMILKSSEQLVIASCQR